MMKHMRAKILSQDGVVCCSEWFDMEFEDGMDSSDLPAIFGSVRLPAGLKLPQASGLRPASRLTPASKMLREILDRPGHGFRLRTPDGTDFLVRLLQAGSMARFEGRLFSRGG